MDLGSRVEFSSVSFGLVDVGRKQLSKGKTPDSEVTSYQLVARGVQVHNNHILF